MKAVQCQQEFCAIYLLQHGADPNVVDLHSNTALHFAAFNSSISIAEHLLEYNANIDAQNKDGNTPLTLAVAESNQEMAEFLLKKGASVNARENSGRTPLMTAASNGDDALISILIQYGADVSDKDTNGWTAEDYAAIGGYSEVSKKLAGYDSGKHAEKSSSDSRKGLSVFNSPDKDGDTGFTLGAPATNKEVVDDLSGDSSRDSRKTDDDSWLSSEDEDLDFNPKKSQKPSLAHLVNVSKQIKKSNESSSIIRTDHMSSSQQSNSDCEAEDLHKCMAKPFFPVMSFPQPARSSPGSFSKPIQMSASHFGIKQEESSGEDEEEDENRKVSVLDRNVIYSHSHDQNPLQDGNFKKDISPLGMDEEVEDKNTESPWDSEEPEGTEPKVKKKLNFLEELGFDVADDVEDESDWDSTSISIKSIPSAKHFNDVVLEDNTKSDAASKKLEIIPVGVELSDAQTIIPVKDGQCNEQKDIKEIENDENKVEEGKTKKKLEELETAGKSENAAIEKTLAVNTIVQKNEQKLTVKENQCIKSEGEMLAESQVNKVTATKELVPIAVRSMKDIRKSENKRRISKQRASQQITENPPLLHDDSSLSETSVEEVRKSARTVTGKNKIPKTAGLSEDFDDLTQSSDTATEDIDSPSSVSREALMLMEQLSLDNKADSVSLLKIQNIVHGYERLIEREKGRYVQMLGKVKKIENEKKELQRILEEMREMKSLLDHQKVEWESNINTLKYSLKQEEEKRLSAEMLYEKNQERLRKKEEQCCKEMEEKQQQELMLRSLEMELRTLKNHLKEVEERHNETQRQLTQEQNARALQEGILNTHLWRQKELEEESKRTLAKSSEMADNHDPEKDLLHKNHILQDELAVLRFELDQIKVQRQEEEAKYLEENEALKEKIDELKKELKLNEEALTQTVFQYSGQINVTKTESAMLTSKLEHIKENKERLEVELDSFRSRLSSTTQELERTIISKNDLERTLQRERDEWLRLKDKLNHDLFNLQETNNSMSQLLSKTESKTNGLENELHHVTHTLREKNLLIESIQRDLSQAQCQVKELENTRQMEKDQMNKYVIKQESMQERLAQLQSENILLRQQLEDFQNQGVIKERVVSDVQYRFNDIFTKLRADTEKQIQMVEERNKELITKCSDLRDQVFKYETEKVEREGALRQLQQELADSLKKQSMSEASLEVTTRYRNDLEEDKQQLQKEMQRIKSKLQESEEQYIHSERRTQDLKNALDAKESEASMLSQKLQDLLVASSGTNNAIKQLEEHIQRLEIENARLEATNKQQTSRIEILQKELQDSTSVHNRLEELITGLQTTKIRLEEQLNHQVQKQTVLSATAQDTHNMWEEELRSRSKLGARLSELDRERTELMAEFDSEKKKVKKLAELKRSVEIRLGQEMKRNNELQKECNGIKKLLKTTKKKLKEYESGENSSQTSLQGEMKTRYTEIDSEVGKLKTKIDELSHQLEVESTRCTRLESTNRDLREQLSSVKILHKNHEKLEKSKLQLEDEVANLRRHVQSNTIDYNQREQYRREIEERARQEIRQKLEEVNLFLQTQAASQETVEQMRATNNASLKAQLEHRIGDLESELAKLKNSQQDNAFYKESTHTELERYKGLYLEELKMRKVLGSKLDRANEKLSETNAKLLHEHQRNKSLLASNFVSGSLSASPVLETIQFGNLSSNLALNRTLSLGGGFMNPSGNALSSKNRVEAYLAKMQMELEKNITRELDQASAELDAGSVRVSPVGSLDGSSKKLNMEQDQVSKATQQYLDVLKKNYMI
ncbi:ankyrin repeat domain-containing protein 26-like [Eublepharis macularius]|uniref:Ankyrin repeat domain-containing protein 26-like n=1 Tax=Eublepharis macularius TaxID=481883 RepID=A0AA97JWH5_EUBMA|nr:ankyrin repeat domain-containing protein 26-like [Eublepharis macularius]